MPTPSIPSNTVINLATLETLTGNANRESVELLGFYAENDGGGGVFYWDSGSTITVNAGNRGMYANPNGANPGRWIRVFDDFINVKWLGAKGDDTTDDRVNFQKSLDFIQSATISAGAFPYSLYISRGIYLIGAPDSTDSALSIDITAFEGLTIYGDGAGESVVKANFSFVDPPMDQTSLFTILCTDDSVNEISDCQFYGAYGYVTGLRIVKAQTTLLRNVTLTKFFIGGYIEGTNDISFINCLISYNNIGIKAEKGDGSNPNEFNFISCRIVANGDVGVSLIIGHSATFQSCDLSANGLTGEIGAIYFEYEGTDGANGLNVIDCYFESNKGDADIKVDTIGFGSHTFTGNTFLRLSDSDFTDYNILIEGDTEGDPPFFGQNSTKLVFQGNGFFTKDPYEPYVLRKAIHLVSDNYWKFDVVEQGNTYTYVDATPIQVYDAVSAPIFNLPLMQPEEIRLIPQISEYTRVKAFGRINETDILHGYNLASVKNDAIGTYEITFANKFNPAYYSVSLTAVGSNVLLYVSVESDNKVEIRITDLTGDPAPSIFDITIF